MYILFFAITFIIAVMLFTGARKMLQKLQFGQVVRDDGPATHLKKKGTPTMAGVVFIIVLVAFIIVHVVVKKSFSRIDFIILFIVLFGLIGFADDYLKVSKKNTKGLPSSIKFVGQIIIAAVGIIVCFMSSPFDNILFFAVLIFIVVGTDNGVNFTDGLDGLCTCVTIIVSIFYIILFVKMGNVDFVIVNVVVLAMLFAFLVFNHYPAKLFMGDTGSLLLGAYVAFMSIELGIEFMLPIYGFIYMMEVLSVVLQVSYFKMTGGKRIFKMAPIHHHFEKCGYSENRIVVMFSVVTLILTVITYFIIGA